MRNIILFLSLVFLSSTLYSAQEEQPKKTERKLRKSKRLEAVVQEAEVPKVPEVVGRFATYTNDLDWFLCGPEGFKSLKPGENVKILSLEAFGVDPENPTKGLLNYEVETLEEESESRRKFFIPSKHFVISYQDSEL